MTTTVNAVTSVYYSDAVTSVYYSDAVTSVYYSDAVTSVYYGDAVTSVYYSQHTLRLTFSEALLVDQLDLTKLEVTSSSSSGAISPLVVQLTTQHSALSTQHSAHWWYSSPHSTRCSIDSGLHLVTR